MKNSNDIIITFTDNCEWKGDKMMSAYIKEVFAHAKIPAAEIRVGYIRYDNGQEVDLFVKELDEPNGELIEKEYCIHLFEDCAFIDCFTFAHFLWRLDGGGDITLIDQAIYQVFNKGNGKYNCLCIAEET